MSGMRLWIGIAAAAAAVVAIAAYMTMVGNETVPTAPSTTPPSTQPAPTPPPKT